MSTSHPATTAEVHPALLQAVALTLRPTVGEPVDVETRVLDLEPYGDGGTALVVACPDGLDPDEHHFDASVAWTYPLGRMVCSVSTRPAVRHYGRVWLLRPSAAPTRLQQRTFFRARVAVPVALAWPVDMKDDVKDGGEVGGEVGREDDMQDDGEGAGLDTEDGTPPCSLLGVAVDLSEGGVLAATQGPLPEPGTTVEVTIRIDGDNLVQPASIVRHVRFAGGGMGIAVSFADPTIHGDRIRRAIFETERRRRRPR